MAKARIRWIKTQRAPREYDTAYGVQPEHGRSLRQDKTRRMCKQDIQHIHLVKTRHTTYTFSQCKLNFVLFSPMPFSPYEKLITPYSFEIALSVLGGNGTHHIGQCRPNGNSPSVSMSMKCRTKHTRRHRESMRKKVQGTRARRARASLELQQERRLWYICMTNSTARQAKQGEGRAACSQRTCSGSTRRVPGVSLPLSLVCIRAHTTT